MRIIKVFSNFLKFLLRDIKEGDVITIEKSDYLVTRTPIGNSNKTRINLKLISKIENEKQ